jgi:hypothetical protein
MFKDQKVGRFRCQDIVRILTGCFKIYSMFYIQVFLEIIL